MYCYSLVCSYSYVVKQLVICTVFKCMFSHTITYFIMYIYVCLTFRNERRKYHSHREKSRLYPDKFLTLIVDGMDQSKTNLPNTKLIAKSTSSLWRLRTHITGVIMHTKAPFAKLVYCFVDLVQYPHDSNLTLTVILNVLVDFAKINSHFPEVLYLQMDNTCRENKNRFVLTFCAALVHLRIFKKVRILLYHVLCNYSIINIRFRLISCLLDTRMRI